MFGVSHIYGILDAEASGLSSSGLRASIDTNPSAAVRPLGYIREPMNMTITPYFIIIDSLRVTLDVHASVTIKCLLKVMEHGAGGCARPSIKDLGQCDHCKVALRHFARLTCQERDASCQPFVDPTSAQTLPITTTNAIPWLP